LGGLKGWAELVLPLAEGRQVPPALSLLHDSPVAVKPAAALTPIGAPKPDFKECSICHCYSQAVNCSYKRRTCDQACMYRPAAQQLVGELAQATGT
jgi:hypothetical protein